MCRTRIRELSLPRFRLWALMLVVAVVALTLGAFVPELRRRDRASIAVVLAAGFAVVYGGVSFTPTWIVLVRLRRRLRSGEELDRVDGARLVGVFILSLGVLVVLGIAAKWLLMGWRG